MISIANKFDVSIYDSAQWSTHTNIRANPCWEEQEFVIEKMPTGCPRKRNVIHTEGFDGGGQPCKDTNDENHGEHHRAHGAHLNFELLWHHLLAQCVGFFHENWVAIHSSIVHHLSNLRLAVSNVCLFDWIRKEISQYGIHRH